ncbi:MAG: histidine phosphatase family protein [Planctomycetes bacterium]|nr:histidine phosphatase family protein [Planctomycetota bacterium]
MSKRLILIRHASVDKAYAGRYLSATEAHLSEKGQREAKALRDQLADFRPEVVLCSPLLRTRETAALAFPDLPIQELPELREVDFGKWDGLNYSEIEREFADEVREWNAFAKSFRFPEGESIAEFCKRVEYCAQFIREMRQDLVVAVTHGGVTRFMLCYLLGIDYRLHFSFRISPASVAILDLSSDGASLSGLSNPAVDVS